LLNHHINGLSLTDQGAQCDKLTTVVGRQLTVIATVDVPWQNFSKVQSFGQSSLFHREVQQLF